MDKIEIDVISFGIKDVTNVEHVSIGDPEI